MDRFLALVLLGKLFAVLAAVAGVLLLPRWRGRSRPGYSKPSSNTDSVRSIANRR